MSTALSSPNTSPGLALPAPLARLTPAQRIRLAVGASALAALMVGAVLLATRPDYRVLFASVNDKDGGAIVAQLAQMNVPYRYSEGGGAILVPSDRVHDVRLRLASQGLPKGQAGGFESQDTARFGMTQFQERLSFQRGLEGELARSIQALSSVSSARVHLALPAANGFFREQQKPSASVLLALHPGHTLERAQVAGIVHLVASSVPQLDTRAVSVVDEAGNLLSGQSEAGAADLQQLQYQRSIEQNHVRRIVELLEPVVGRGNVRAQVTAEVDFSQSEATVEQHKPNQAGDAAVIRSQHVVENGGSAAPAGVGGVPGAASNQPPGPVSAPLQGAAGAPAAGQPGAAAAAAGQARRESTTNYEVDRTVRVVRAGAGAVKRLTAAVVVNHRTLPDASGKPVTRALPAEEMERLNALVREAVGFSQERGDSINLMNAAFVPEAVPVDNLPLWQRREVRELAQQAVWPMALLLSMLVVVFGVIRPALKAMRQPVPVPAPVEPGAPALLTEIESEMPARAPLLPAAVAPAEPELSPAQLRLQEARDMARGNPAAVASIVKGWVNGEGAAA